MSTDAFINAQKFQPNVVIIKLGTNDSKPENWKYKDEFETDLEYMISTFQKCGSKPKLLYVVVFRQVIIYMGFVMNLNSATL